MQLRNGELKEYAKNYLTLGFTVYPAEGKRVRINDWGKIPAEDIFTNQYASFWKNATGIGFLCGEKSGVICFDIDLDKVKDKELIDEIEARLPPLFSGKSGNPDRPPSRFFRYNGEKSRKFNSVGVEILSTGNQTIIPPSKHPDFDKNYEWVGKSLLEISDYDDLPNLPEGLIDWLDQKNRELKAKDVAVGQPDKSLRKQHGRCAHGSHNVLSALGVALVHQNYPFDLTKTRLLERDRQINHDSDYLYFQCPSRRWKTNDISKNCDYFLDEIYKRHSPDGFVSEKFQKKELKPEPEIELLPLGELLQRPDENISYLVENLLPTGGTSILAAKPKCGKTTLLRQLSLSVARGELFLNRVTSQGPVIYFSVEEKIDEIKSHFKAMGAKGNEEIYIFASRAPRETLKKLEPLVEKIKPSLIILDTLFKVIRMKDANDYASISEALEPVQELARLSGAHIMCVHHAGKSERQGADAILGSTAILAAFDTAIMMDRIKNQRCIKSLQRYGTDLEESTLIWDPVKRLSTLGQEKWRQKAEDRSKEVLDFVKQAKEKVTFQDIRQTTGMDVKLLRKTLKFMVDQKILDPSGTGTKGDPQKYCLYKSALFKSETTKN